MYNDPYNPEKSPNSQKRMRPPEELDPRWDSLADEYGNQNSEASPEEWAEKMGEMPEFEERPQLYEKVATTPIYGVDGEGDAYNQLMTDFLAKGFWLRAKEDIPSDLNQTEIKTQFDNITEGQTTEGGEMKYESLSESGVSGETAVNVFELSKRADFGTDELSNVVEGIPALSDIVKQLSGATREIEQMLKNDASPEELREKYTACLDITDKVHADLARANVSVELSGAILSKIKTLELSFRSALNSLTVPAGGQSENEATEEGNKNAVSPVGSLDAIDLAQDTADKSGQTSPEPAIDKEQKFSELEEGLKELGE